MNPAEALGPLGPALFAANRLRRAVVGAARGWGLRRWSASTGPHPRQAVHFWADGEGRRPGVLLVHGGGWRKGSWRDYAPLGPRLARAGLLVGAAGYRLAPEHRWPAQLDDARAAFEALVAAGAGPVALWGHSAGAQLALLLALDAPERVAGVVAMGAPADLARLTGPTAEELPEVFGPADLRAASPLHHPCERPPPVLLVHGGRDPVCPVEQARLLRERWPERVRLVEVPGGDHGLRWPPRAAFRAREEAVRWLLERLRSGAAGAQSVSM